MLNTVRISNANVHIYSDVVFCELSLLSLTLLIVICQPLKYISLLGKSLEAFYNTFLTSSLATFEHYLVNSSSACSPGN